MPEEAGGDVVFVLVERCTAKCISFFYLGPVLSATGDRGLESEGSREGMVGFLFCWLRVRPRGATPPLLGEEGTCFERRPSVSLNGITLL